VGRTCARYGAAILAVGLLTPAPPVSADTVQAVPILGGTAALARSLGLETVPDPERFIAELSRVVYAVPEGESPDADAQVRLLVRRLRFLAQVKSGLDVLQQGTSGLTLERTSLKPYRERLDDWLNSIGLRLRKQQNTFTVEPDGSDDASERIQILHDVGVDVEALRERLNRGDTLQVSMPSESVPVPLSASVWSTAVFARDVGAEDLAAAILADRRAALLCYGLAALDPPTREYLARNPATLTWLYRHASGAFAGFGDALRIRDDRVVVPGGPAAMNLWRAMLDEPADRPDRFIQKLFGRDNGRFAYVYDVVAALDEPHRAFALGLWMPDAVSRLDRFKTLLAEASYAEWQPALRPFRRPPVELGIVLASVRTHASGRPAAPASRGLWSRGFESVTLPDRPLRELEKIDEADVIDAAWLARAVAGPGRRNSTERLAQFAFGQRVFTAAPTSALPDVLVALRGFGRYPMLMVTLERTGITSPALYAAAARQAAAIGALDGDRAVVALCQFQGALSLVTRMARVGQLAASDAETMLNGLVGVPLSDDGRYNGALSRWLQEVLERQLGSYEDVDTALAVRLGGRSEETAASPISFEGQQYRVDIAASEVRRIQRLSAHVNGFPLRSAFTLQRLADRLSDAKLTIDVVASVAADLKQLSEEISQAPAAPRGSTPDLDAVRSSLSRSLNDLSGIQRPKDLDKVTRVQKDMLRAGDVLLADALRSWTYVLDTNERVIVGGDEARRHDFGLATTDGEQRLRAPWQMPSGGAAQGEPWHMTGSLLGLESGLARQSLPRVPSAEPPTPALMAQIEQDTYARTAVLLDPRKLRDADLERLTHAIERGRERLAGLPQSELGIDALADGIGMDGWRREAIRWALQNDPKAVPTFVTLGELLEIGSADQDNANWQAWGADAGSAGGCACVVWPRSGDWRLFIGREQTGLLATRITDLTLNVALALQAQGLPAALVSGVVESATRDFIDRVRVLYSDDWLGLQRSAGAIGPERIEDYISELTVNGPLVPVRQESTGRP
jgi:hypothetical protein